MKKFSKILAIICAICLVFSLCSCDVGLSKKTADLSLFDFELLEDETYSISAKQGVELPSYLVLPSTYEDTQITTIAYEGFKGYVFTKLAIPEGYTTIEAYAFYQCSSLKNLEIPNSLKYIKQGAFSECSGIVDTMRFGNKLISIESKAFASCSSILSAEVFSTTTVALDAFPTTTTIVIK